MLFSLLMAAQMAWLSLPHKLQTDGRTDGVICFYRTDGVIFLSQLDYCLNMLLQFSSRKPLVNLRDHCISLPETLSMTSATGQLGPQSFLMVAFHGLNTLQYTRKALQSLVQALRMREPCFCQTAMTAMERCVWTSASTGRIALSVEFTQAINPRMTPSWFSLHGNAARDCDLWLC